MIWFLLHPLETFVVACGLYVVGLGIWLAWAWLAGRMAEGVE